MPAIQATSPISERTMPRKNAMTADSATMPMIARSNPVIARQAASESDGRASRSIRRRDDAVLSVGLETASRAFRRLPRAVRTDANSPDRATRRRVLLGVRRMARLLEPVHQGIRPFVIGKRRELHAEGAARRFRCLARLGRSGCR